MQPDTKKRPLTRRASGWVAAAVGVVLYAIWMLTYFLLGSINTAAAETFEMNYIETEDLRLLYFDPPQTYLVPHVARSFHNSLAFQQKIFEWQPYDRNMVLLKDFTDYGNAAAGASPNNKLAVDIAPLSRTFETFTASERMFMLMNHELAHVATMDAWNQQDRRWRRFFLGKPVVTDKHPESILYNYLATPRISVPRWYLEGSAVFLETWMSGGLGRAQGAYDEMVFRSMVRDNAHFYDPLGLVSEGTSIDFQVGVNSYLYGTRFMSYLALEHGPMKVIEWLRRGANSERYYARQFEKVFGRSLPAEWEDWINWEREFQRENLARVSQFPLTPVEDLASKGLGSISRGFISPDGKKLLAGFRYPGVVAHLGALDLASGSIEKFTDIKGPMLYRVTALAYDPAASKLYYTTDNNAFRDLMGLDLTSGERQMLIKDGRIGELVLNPADKSLWGVRHLNGYATLVQLEPPYTSWRQVHSWPYGEGIFDLDISPDGQLLSASKSEINGDQRLQVFRLADLLAGSAEPITQFDFGTAMPEGFVFSPDGEYLFGSSYYTGVSNIFRYELANGALEAVSNTDTGFFRPLPLADDRLMVFRYTGEGLRPAVIDPRPLEDVGSIRFLGNEIVRRHPEVKEWQVGSPADIDLDALVKEEGKFRPLSEIELQSAYPIVEGYKDSFAFGWHFHFADQMEFNGLRATVSYSPDDDLAGNEKFHASLDYRALFWRLRYWHNGANFYDLFGPTKVSRKGDAFLVDYSKALIYDRPRQLDFAANVSHFTGLDTLPGAQNVATVDDTLTRASVSLDYRHTRHSLGHVDEEKGFQWKLVASGDHAGSETVAKLRGDFDFGFALPWKHSSIWLRSTAGFADGDRANPYASFYFGGFGNNYVDDGAVKRYREYYSFPGFELNALSGQNFAKSTLEWNLPPKRFRGVGTPGFYLSHIRPAFFYGALVTDPDSNSFRRTVTNLGFQADLQFTILHRLDMTLSAGYALGFEQGDKLDDEWMVSLKIL